MESLQLKKLKQMKQKSNLLFVGKLYFILALCTCVNLSALANDNEGNGIVKGKVVTADGGPAAYVTILVKGTKKSTVTDEDGNFVIRGLSSGSYELEISLVGYETISKTVEVADQEIITITIELHLSSKELAEVVVASGRNGFTRKSSDYVARLPLKNLENPQVYNTITKELLTEQVITSFNDAVKNAPGLDKLWTSTGRGGDGAAYFSLRGFSVQPTMINGVAGLTNGGLDPANIERIEVIKGPSGTLFGSSLISFGGLINIVTKKPYEEFGGEISYTGGGFGLSRITADINTPINKDKTALLRVNGAYHYENSFQDAGFKRSFFLAPSLSYQVNDRLSFLVNTEFFNSESTNPLMLFLNRTRELEAKTIEELNVDYYKSFTSNDLTIKNPTVNLYGQVNYKLSDKWVAQTNLSRSTRKSDGYYSYVMYRADGDTLLNRYVSNQNSISTSTDIQQNFIGDFTIGKLRNRMVVGIDYFNVVTVNNSSAYLTFDTVNSVSPDPKYAMLNRAAVDAKLAVLTPAKSTAKNNVYSAYVSDVVNVTENLSAMLSLRVDRFDNASGFAQTAFSPKFGLVYQVVKDKISVFGNYMNGFRNVNAATQPDGTVRQFEPQQANQWEGGVKMDLFGGKLSGSLSYYDIYVTNVTRPDPENAGYTIQDGNVYSRGFEADITAHPFPGLNIIAGYSHNESKNDKTTPTIMGLRPNSAGPADLVNAWISYQLVSGSLKGLGFGFGGNYASENLITNTTVTGGFALPAYTILNASIFYNAKAFRVALKADNLTDKKYYKGWSTVEPQMLRRIAANITFKL